MAREVTDGLAHRRVLGRRPETVKWVPSKPLPWWISTWSEDARFTAEQELALMSLGRDPVTADAITVRRDACPYTEISAPLGQWLPIYEFEAPVIGTRADGKVTIIAPDGSRRHIRADGWAHKPSTRPYQGGMMR